MVHTAPAKAYRLLAFGGRYAIASAVHVMTDTVLVITPTVSLLLTAEAFEVARQAADKAVQSKAQSATRSDDNLLSADELAARLSLPVTWIEQKAREGELPSYEAGRWRRFRQSEVEATLRRNES